MRERLPDFAAQAHLSVSEFSRLMDRDHDLGYE